MLSHASLKNNKHLNILSSQLNRRKERTSQNHKTYLLHSGTVPAEWGEVVGGRTSILSVMPNTAPNKKGKLQVNIIYENMQKSVSSHVRHYWQNGGTALNFLLVFHRHRSGMKELGFVILPCFFLSLAELTEENIKVLIVFERRMRKHKAFCSCAQKIIHKVNHWPLFKDFCKKVFQGEHTCRSLRPWEGLLSEAYLWGKCLWQRSLLNLGLRNN